MVCEVCVQRTKGEIIINFIRNCDIWTNKFRTVKNSFELRKSNINELKSDKTGTFKWLSARKWNSDA